MDMKQYSPITDKRGKTVHFSALGFKPICKPGTKIVFHATTVGINGTKLCKVCAERELQVRYENGER